MREVRVNPKEPIPPDHMLAPAEAVPVVTQRWEIREMREVLSERRPFKRRDDPLHTLMQPVGPRLLVPAIQMIAMGPCSVAVIEVRVRLPRLLGRKEVIEHPVLEGVLGVRGRHSDSSLACACRAISIFVAHCSYGSLPSYISGVASTLNSSRGVMPQNHKIGRAHV